MLKRISKYFISASFVGIVLGVLGIYYTLRGSRTHLSMDIAAESNVLDLRHPMPDLAIVFQGKDIEEAKSNLKVLTIRVINDGEANIHENDFDSKIPFGLQIEDGRVVRAQVAGSNSSYLLENLRPRVDGQDRVVFDKVIFDKGRFVGLELLVIHPKNTNPQIKPLGKIAGLDEIVVTKSFQEREQSSFLDQVFSGPAAIQITRTIAYAFLGLMTIVAIGFSIAGVSSIPSRWKKIERRRIANRLTRVKPQELERKRKAIELIFIEHGIRGLTRAQKLHNNEDTLKKEMRARRDFYGRAIALDVTGEEATAMRIHQARSIRLSSLAPLVSAELITLKDDELKIDPEIKPLLADFIGQLS